MADKVKTKRIFNLFGSCWDFEYNGQKYNIPQGEREYPAEIVDAIQASLHASKLKVFTDKEREARLAQIEKEAKAKADAEKAAVEKAAKEKKEAAEKAKMDAIRREISRREEMLQGLKVDIIALKQRIEDDTKTIKEKEKQIKEIEATITASEKAVEKPKEEPKEEPKKEEVKEEPKEDKKKK